MIQYLVNQLFQVTRAVVEFAIVEIASRVSERLLHVSMEDVSRVKRQYCKLDQAIKIVQLRVIYRVISAISFLCIIIHRIYSFLMFELRIDCFQVFS